MRTDMSTKLRGALLSGAVGLVMSAVQLAAGATVVFTNDTVIAPTDLSYDGQDVVVSHCTVTVDGPHTLASLLVDASGVLTHSIWPGGSSSNAVSVTNLSYLLNGTNPVTLPNSNIIATSVRVTDLGARVTYTNALDYLLGDLTGGWTTLRRTANSTIPDGASVWVSYTAVLAVWPAGVNLTVTGAVAVAAGGKIDASGRGFSGSTGTGKGGSAGNPADGGGAGHGGYGGISSSNAPGGTAYGAIEQPTTLGSGGGSSWIGAGGPGGGAIKLTVGGGVTIDGVISANGLNAVNSRSGGGAGGSIGIAADTIAGSGTIAADGGAGEPIHGGGGGGGRIALCCNTTNAFSGSRHAQGGAGLQAGGAGTLYFQSGTLPVGTLVVDNLGQRGAGTPVTTSTNLEFLVVNAGAVACPTNLSVTHLVVGSNSWLSLLPGALSLVLTVTEDAVFAPSSGIDAVGKGYPYAQGPGAGLFYSSGGGSSGGGAGHAGYGGSGQQTSTAKGGVYYGSMTQPILAGSGGGGNASYPGGAGGGAVQLSVGRALQLDGSILADGERPPAILSGGGSGGSVWVTAGTFTGSGQISANGGSGLQSIGGGGSGGRVAVYFDASRYTGALKATGGMGFQGGAAGTVLTKTNASSIAQIFVVAGGERATNSFLSSTDPVDLTIQGGAVAGGVSSFHHLTIRSNSSLSVTGMTTTLTVTGDASIEPSAIISLDGLGYTSGYGPGHGNYDGGGGGHGGMGGAGLYGSTLGIGYDDPSGPIVAGSSGGGTSSYPGGPGGGCLRLTVNGRLQLDGRISADGLPGTSGGAGGGAGGSLWLTLNRWAGAGVLSVNGGAGDFPSGSGGGGGRIAATYTSASNTFTGTLTARGGLGYQAGGAGTVYRHGNQDNAAQIVADNGGARGGLTSLNYSNQLALSLSLRGGAYVAPRYSGAFVLQDLFVGSNCWYITDVFSSERWTVAGDVTVETGGGISGDGRGYGGDSGPGRGRYGGGAGHGGYGGCGAAGPSAATGGIANDPAITSPISIGSGAGGSGGGALQMMVSGRLNLDGAISANGMQGLDAGNGGGAGGSLWLTVGGLSGAGRISADGGAGDLPNGGGGGGGRIAITWTSNTFAGTISAQGGVGYVAGGAGTIYTKAAQSDSGHLLVDNGGQRGTNTLVYPYSPGGDLTVKDGAMTAFSTSFSVTNLNLLSNSTILLSTQVVTVTADALIESGASLNADGLGYGAATGPGAGGNTQNPKGGGSHGGWGGANPLAVASGDLQSPITWGSGGGNGSGTNGVAPLGGAGGGAVRLNVSRQLTLHGRISANGSDGGANSGGGAGGSVWLTAGTLAGSGTISANGGAGNNTGGGGGGGRVALQFTTNVFNGSVAAVGGAGSAAGGAGTALWQPIGGANPWLAVDNGGLPGNNTPLFALPAALDLIVANGAVVHAQTNYPLFNSVSVGAGGRIASLASQTNLEVSTMGDLTIAAGGALTLDGRGYSAGNGMGAGATLASEGGGGGYGGAGGAAVSGAAGGSTYGSATQPTDRGSSGGAAGLAGSEGGGAIRLRVGGTLALEGWLSADGNDGWNDSAGGGSGGSVWITAKRLAGGGSIRAQGGEGEWFNGGGGGGGRIALYSPMNSHTGLVSVLGGAGANAGQNGTVVLATDPPGIQAVSHSPTGVVSNLVSKVTVTFTDVVNPGSVAASDFALVTPAGLQTNLTAAASGLFNVTVFFPTQNLVGEYQLTVGAGIENLFGQSLAQPYTGTFTVALPTISGTVTGTNGQPVPGVVLQATGSWLPAITDTNGFYSLPVPPGWSGGVTPALGRFVLVPKARAYSTVTNALASENYVTVDSIAPQITATASGTNFWLNWHGIGGVTYRVWVSTNLVNWTSEYPWYVVGTNGPTGMRVPASSPAMQFYRLAAFN